MKFWNPGREITSLNVDGLAGQKITYYMNDDRYEAIVGGVDPYIGISLVKANDPEKPLMCLYGPFAPGFQEHYLHEFLGDFRKERYINRYKIYLEYLREVVEGNGMFIEAEFANRLEDANPEYGPASGGGSCPYGV